MLRSCYLGIHKTKQNSQTNKSAEKKIAHLYLESFERPNLIRLSPLSFRSTQIQPSFLPDLHLMCAQLIFVSSRQRERERKKRKKEKRRREREEREVLEKGKRLLKRKTKRKDFSNIV